eukprot:717650-Pyramimonas_sp.AAC.1
MPSMAAYRGAGPWATLLEATMCPGGSQDWYYVFMMHVLPETPFNSRWRRLLGLPLEPQTHNN